MSTIAPARSSRAAGHAVAAIPFPTGHAEKVERYENALSDEVLLQICRIRVDNPQVTSEWISTIRRVARLLDQPGLRQEGRLEAAMTVLASSLGQLEQFQLISLPFGYEGPMIRSAGWIERETLDRIGTQLLGLTWRHASAEVVANAIGRAVSESVRLRFLEQREYDAWRPGMPSGSGWRAKISATPYGVMKAVHAATSLADIEAAVSDRARVAKADSGQPEERPVESRVAFSEQQSVSCDAPPAPPCAPCQPQSVASPPRSARPARPLPRRGTRTANIEKLEKELEKHLLAARDHAHSVRDRGGEPALLPRPSQKELARRTDLSETDVSRCLNDNRATVLKLLWETSESLDAVMNYKRRR